MRFRNIPVNSSWHRRRFIWMNFYVVESLMLASKIKITEDNGISSGLTKNKMIQVQSILYRVRCTEYTVQRSQDTKLMDAHQIQHRKANHA